MIYSYICTRHCEFLYAYMDCVQTISAVCTMVEIIASSYMDRVQTISAVCTMVEIIKARASFKFWISETFGTNCESVEISSLHLKIVLGKDHGEDVKVLKSSHNSCGHYLWWDLWITSDCPPPLQSLSDMPIVTSVYTTKSFVVEVVKFYTSCKTTTQTGGSSCTD